MIAKRFQLKYESLSHEQKKNYQTIQQFTILNAYLLHVVNEHRIWNEVAKNVHHQMVNENSENDIAAIFHYVFYSA